MSNHLRKQLSFLIWIQLTLMFKYVVQTVCHYTLEHGSSESCQLRNYELTKNDGTTKLAMFFK